MKILAQWVAAWLLIVLGSLGMLSWLGFALSAQGFDPHNGFLIGAVLRALAVVATCAGAILAGAFLRERVLRSRG